MKVTIKRFDLSLPLPAYQTAGAAALDLYSRLDLTVNSHSIVYVPLNIALQLPPDQWLLMAARSSLHKKGLMLINGIGVGDHDFCGDGDEYHAALYNFSDEMTKIKKGERLVQMIILPRQKVELIEVKQFGTNEDRGGYGSTGER
jgi:dUTP pyrophosphatase